MLKPYVMAPCGRMASTNHTRGIRPNGPKIRALRKGLGLSQRDFSNRHAVTTRTLQRAENSEVILPELLNSIATGLQVAMADIVQQQRGNEAVSTPMEPDRQQVRLLRTESAREIIAALETVTRLAYIYDINPDEETAEELVTALEIIEQLSGAPDGAELKPTTYVRQLGRLNILLNGLETKKIRFYVGSYWEPDVVIEEVSAPENATQICRVELICQGIMLIGAADLRYVTRPIVRKYSGEQIDASIEELRSFGWHVEDKRPSS